MDGFAQELDELGNFPRGDLITALTMIAEDAQDSQEELEQVVSILNDKIRSVSSACLARVWVDFNRGGEVQAAPDCKLPLVYVVDSILKTVGKYQDAFRSTIVDTVNLVFDTASPRDQMAVRRMLGTWEDAGLFLDLVPAMYSHMAEVDPRYGMESAAKRMRPADPPPLERGPPPQTFVNPYGSAPRADPPDPYASVPSIRQTLSNLSSLLPAAPPKRTVPELLREAEFVAHHHASGVPDVLAELFQKITDGIQSAQAERVEFSAGKASQTVAKVNPPLATVLMRRLNDLPSRDDMLERGIPREWHQDPFISAVETQLILHRLRTSPAISTLIESATASSASTDTAADTLLALGLPPVDLSTAVLRGTSFEQDRSVLYPAESVQSVQSGWRFASRAAMGVSDDALNSLTMDIESRELSSRAWWFSSDEWAEWHRELAGSEGRLLQCDTMAPSFFELQRLKREAETAETAAAVAGSSRAAVVDVDDSSETLQRFKVHSRGRENVCTVCGEPFDKEMDDQTKGWVYLGAVETKTGLKHAACVKASTSLVQEAPPLRPEPSGNGDMIGADGLL
jgi:hypothetical protein